MLYQFHQEDFVNISTYEMSFITIVKIYQCDYIYIYTFLFILVIISHCRCRNYLLGWFILDFITCLNVDVIIIYAKVTMKMWYVKIPAALKILRIITLIKYLNRFRDVSSEKVITRIT